MVSNLWRYSNSKIFPRCCQKHFFGSVDNNANHFSALWSTTPKNDRRCGQQYGKTHELKLEYFSALLPTIRKIIGVAGNSMERFPHCGQQRGKMTGKEQYNNFCELISTFKGTVYLNYRHILTKITQCLAEIWLKTMLS
jgi:hypothetical protein